MPINPDFRDMLSALSTAQARFLVVGAHAVAHHTEPRYTKDFDIWVEASPDNAQRVWAALRAFGAPTFGTRAEEFARPNLVLQIGVEPNRIDLLTSITGVRFDAAWRNRVAATYGGVSIDYLGVRELIRHKLAVGRPVDLNDVDRLRQARRTRQRRRPPRKRR